MDVFKEVLFPLVFLTACVCLLLGALLSTQRRAPRPIIQAKRLTELIPRSVSRARDQKALLLPIPARQKRSPTSYRHVSFCRACGKPLAASDEDACGFCGHPFDPTLLAGFRGVAHELGAHRQR